MAACTLDRLEIGQRGRVVKLSAEPDVRHRLMEMGLSRGTIVRLVRFAPMGDPIDIELRGYHLSLRKAEARFIQVEPQHNQLAHKQVSHKQASTSSPAHSEASNST